MEKLQRREKCRKTAAFVWAPKVKTQDWFCPLTSRFWLINLLTHLHVGHKSKPAQMWYRPLALHKHCPTNTPLLFPCFFNMLSVQCRNTLKQTAHRPAKVIGPLNTNLENLSTVQPPCAEHIFLPMIPVTQWKNLSIYLSIYDSPVCCVAESFVQVGLRGRTSVPTLGDSVELACRVTGLNQPVTLAWTLQRDGSSLDNILTMYSDGAISWAREQHSYQMRVQKNPQGLYYYLAINGVSLRDAGRYQCHVVVSLKNVPRKLESNLLAMNVREPGRA